MQIQLHEDFIGSSPPLDAAFVSHLVERRRQLRARIAEQVAQRDHLNQADTEMTSWIARTYPVLAILAPAMTTNQGKIEYPGDPMCLYAALSVATDQVIKAREIGLLPEIAATGNNEFIYSDLCPRWGFSPSREYRFQVSDSGIRDYSSSSLNTDQTIFDPRIWDEEVKHYLTDYVLKTIQPKVVLISCVSPAHRYAIEIARHIRKHLPGTLIVFGGRHMDETIRFHDKTKQLTLSYSSTPQAIFDGRVEPVVDFIISGEGYFALDLLMKAISIAMNLQSRTATVCDVVRTLDKLSSLIGPVAGRAILLALDNPSLHIYPIRGPQFELSQLPSPYQNAAIRARFPIFQSATGSTLRTAHMMMTNACPYHCDFCSEGITVVGHRRRYAHALVASGIERVLEYISYGAEAVFFDDSVFCSGNMKHMTDFSKALMQARLEAQTCQPSHFPWLQDFGDLARLMALQWGMQLTAEFLTTLHPPEKTFDCLSAMRAAGCTYIYMGIESLAASIMNKIHKNLLRVDGPSWAEKIRQALLLVKNAGIRVGSSILFGLNGETRETIEITIEGVGQFIDEGLLYLSSPNILTYHPATAITQQHGKGDHLDYHSIDISNRPPYTYFEEAYPAVVSKELSEEDIWYIHRRAKERWGQARYSDTIAPVQLSQPLKN